MAADGVQTPSASTDAGGGTAEDGERAYVPAVRCQQDFEKLNECAREVKEQFELSPKTAKNFTGSELVSWLVRRFNCRSDEALHLARMLQLYGFVVLVDKHCSIPPPIRADSSRCCQFQIDRYWPKHSHVLTDFEYAVHLHRLCKSKHGNLELYEEEALKRLERELFKQWPEVLQRSNSQRLEFKKMSASERYVVYAQERVFWSAHRGPGRVMDLSIVHYQRESICEILRIEDEKRAAVADSNRASTRSHQQTTSDDESMSVPRPILNAAQNQKDDVSCLRAEVSFLEAYVLRPRIRTSRAAEMCTEYTEKRHAVDPMVTPVSPSNPWVSGNQTLWEVEAGPVVNRDTLPSNRQYKLWGMDISELLSDPHGSLVFNQFLDKEFSAENILFWNECRSFFFAPKSKLCTMAQDIYDTFLARNAPHQVNVPHKILSEAHESLKGHIHRYIFEPAQRHIYNLMRKDSYQRFILSEDYICRQPANPSSSRGGLFKNLRNRSGTPSGIRRGQSHYQSTPSISSGGKYGMEWMQPFPGMPPSHAPHVSKEEALAFGERLTAPSLTAAISRSPEPEVPNRQDSQPSSETERMSPLGRRDSLGNPSKLSVTVCSPEGTVIETSSQEGTDLTTSNRLDVPAFTGRRHSDTSFTSRSPSPSLIHRLGQRLRLATPSTSSRSFSGSQGSLQDSAAALSCSDRSAGPSASSAPPSPQIGKPLDPAAAEWMMALQYPQGKPQDDL